MATSTAIYQHEVVTDDPTPDPIQKIYSDLNRQIYSQDPAAYFLARISERW